MTITPKVTYMDERFQNIPHAENLRPYSELHNVDRSLNGLLVLMKIDDPNEKILFPEYIYINHGNIYQQYLALAENKCVQRFQVTHFTMVPERLLWFVELRHLRRILKPHCA